MDARMLLEKAADRIETYGWHRGSWVPDEVYRGLLATCPACTGGALALAATNDELVSPNFVPDNVGIEQACELLARTLGLRSSGYCGVWLDSVIRWNDEIAQTQEEVVAALRAAVVTPFVPARRGD